MQGVLFKEALHSISFILGLDVLIYKEDLRELFSPMGHMAVYVKPETCLSIHWYFPST